MSNRNAFLWFLGATLGSLVIFLYLTVDTHRQVGALTNADQMSDTVVAGKRVWDGKNCNLCHTILGFGVYYAPDMTKVFTRIGGPGIKNAVQNPAQVFQASIRHMPDLDVTDEQTDQLIAFLDWTSKIDNHDWPPQDKPRSASTEQRGLAALGLSEGANVFKRSCMGCHSIEGSGGSSGPALDSVGAKYDTAMLVRFVGNPPSVQPGSKMTSQTQLSQEQLQAVGEFLGKQK